MGVKVRQKTKGKGNPWWVFIAHNGKRTSRKVGDKKAAEEVASTIRAKLQLGEFGFEDPKPVPTFKEYADSWIKTTVPATCKETTLRNYQDILRLHVLPVFEELKVNEISKSKVKNFLHGKLNKGFAAGSVGHFRNCISGVLSLPVDDEIIQANPAQQLGRGFLPTKDHKEDANPLTSDELKLLLDTVYKYFPKHYTLFLLLARTGMRIGEAMAVKWGDLDYNRRFIEVKRSYVRGKISTPKNKKSRRIDMSLQLAEALKAHEIISKKKGFALGLGDLPEYVFTNREGTPNDTNNWRRRVFKKALRKAGLREIRIHDLRHTYATLRIAKGDNIADVSNQLGHHSVKLTWDIYYHWIPGKNKPEVDGLDDPMYLDMYKKENNVSPY